MKIYKEMSTADRILFVCSYILSFILLLEVFAGLYFSQWLNAFYAFFCFILTYLPSWFERTIKIIVPLEFELILALFVFAAIYLGEVRLYYESFWWWDVFLHTTSGVLLGFVGFLLMYILNSQRQVPVQMSPLFVFFFSVLFATALGALWEIFEFTLDSVLGLTWQEGLVDTMSDMIVNFLGALVVSFFGYLYIKNVRVALLDTMVKRFVRKNPALFRRISEF